MTDYQVMRAFSKAINGKDIIVKRAFASEGEALKLDDNLIFQNLPFWVYYDFDRFLVGREEIKKGKKIYVTRRHIHNSIDTRYLWQSIIQAART